MLQRALYQWQQRYLQHRKERPAERWSPAPRCTRDRAELAQKIDQRVDPPIVEVIDWSRTRFRVTVVNQESCPRATRLGHRPERARPWRGDVASTTVSRRVQPLAVETSRPTSAWPSQIGYSTVRDVGDRSRPATG
jgi:hypothetical protein